MTDIPQDIHTLSSILDTLRKAQVKGFRFSDSDIGSLWASSCILNAIVDDLKREAPLRLEAAE